MKWSKIPIEFANDEEERFWHLSQNIASRNDSRIECRNGCVFWIDDNGEEALPAPTKPTRVWREAWKILSDKYPSTARWGSHKVNPLVRDLIREDK